MFCLHTQKREGNNFQRQEAAEKSGHAKEMGRGSTIRKGYRWKITWLSVRGYQLDTFFLCSGNESFWSPIWNPMNKMCHGKFREYTNLKFMAPVIFFILIGYKCNFGWRDGSRKNHTSSYFRLFFVEGRLHKGTVFNKCSFKYSC